MDENNIFGAKKTCINDWLWSSDSRLWSIDWCSCSGNADVLPEFGEDVMNILQIRGEIIMTDDGQEFGERFWRS